MARLLNELEQRAEVVCVVVEHLRDRLRLVEGDDAGRPVHLGVQLLGRHHLAQQHLGLGLVELEQLGQPSAANAAVVAGDDANVVLHDSLVQIVPASSAKRRALLPLCLRARHVQIVAQLGRGGGGGSRVAHGVAAGRVGEGAVALPLLLGRKGPVHHLVADELAQNAPME